MRNKPGYSWGPDAKVNLLQAGRRQKWFAVHYFSDDVPGKILKIFRPKDMVEYFDMVKQVTLWNYGTCALCPEVKTEIDCVS